MRKNEINDLLKKYREHHCTLEEEERILRWYEQFDDEVDNMPEIPKGKLEQLWYPIRRRISAVSGKHRRIVFYRYAVAAVLLVAVGTGILYYQKVKEPELPVLAKQDILPARGVATLRLSDGREVLLNHESVIQDREGMLIRNDTLQLLDYTSIDKGTELLYNTISVPVGGEYQVLLADGSSVRLNSCSSLTYPVTFSGEVREVELTGEAFFDVTKSDKPFIVKTADMDVRVLGTSFNVSNYTTDEEAFLVLVSGHVNVKEHKNQQEFNILPGSRFAYDRENNQASVEKVDPELYVSWMMGIFRFEDMRLDDIMSKLSRWYDCNVTYTDDALRDLRFTGAAEKDRSVSYLLSLIETITDVKFEIDGKHILIKHK